MEKNDQNYCIDFLKFIFSVIIVLYHSWTFTGVYGNGYFNRGYCVVDFYFIVTGYLLMNTISKKYKKYKDEDIGKLSVKYIYNKVKNIFPYIFLAFIFGLLFTYGKSLNLNILFSDSIILEIFQLSFLGKGITVNIATWYISAMLIILFISFPLILKFKNNYLFYFRII